MLVRANIKTKRNYMPSEQLRAELAQLHGLLQDTHEIDDSTRQSLSQLAEDIQRLLFYQTFIPRSVMVDYLKGQRKRING